MSRRILVAALVVAAALVVVENLLFLGGRNRPTGTAAGPASQEEAAEYEEAREVASSDADSVLPPPGFSRDRLEAVLISINGEPSPFLLGREREQGVMRRALGLPRLSGTFVGSQRRVAWIEGEPRLAGESFGEFTISRVEPGSVVVIRDGTRYTLEVERSEAPEKGEP